MKRLIERFVKQVGVRVILTKTVQEGILDLYAYAWLGSDDRVYHMVVLANDTSLFVRNGDTFVLSYDSVTDTLQRSLEVSDSLAESGMQEDIAVAEKFVQFMQYRVARPACREFTCGLYRLVEEKLSVRPALGVRILYEAGNHLEVLTVWYGSKTVVRTNDLEFQSFLIGLGYADLIEFQESSEGNEICPLGIGEACEDSRFS